MTSLVNLPNFLVHFVAAVALLGAALAVYWKVTPIDEIGLIRAGNAAAALGFGGAMIGFALTIAAAISRSANLLDAAVWSVIALIAQLGAFFLATRVLGAEWRARLERGEMAPAILNAAAAIATGLLNAACLS